MSDNFHWKKEDSTDWDEPTSETYRPEKSSLRPRLKKWLPWFGLVLAILLIAVGITSAFLNRQVQQVEDNTTADIIAAHALVQQAALDKDFDIFSALLSNRDEDWNKLQKEHLNLDLFLSRRPFHLMVQPDAASLQEIAPTVTLSPDLLTAEFTFQVPYYSLIAGSDSQTIWLEHTYFFKRQDDSWLLNPIPEDQSFWGTWNTTGYGDYFSLIYTDRDEPLANYLGVRLDALIDQICRDERMDCPTGFNLELRLDRQPRSLARLNEYYVNISLSSNQGAYHLSLPSPTLLGRPIDDIGKVALYQGYADWIAGTMAARYSSQGFMTNETEIADIMAQWDLEPPPYPIQPLPIPEPLASPPIPFPDQDILYACSDFSSIDLIRYNPRTNSWRGDQNNSDFSQALRVPTLFGSIMASAPLDDGVLLGIFDSQAGQENDFKLVLWRNGVSQIWLENQSSIQLLPSIIQQQFDPSGRYLVAYESFSTRNSNNFQITPYILDTVACTEGTCEKQDFGGFPFWSPDLSWSLILEPDSQSELMLRNEQTGQETPLGTGFYPHWIDNTTYVYARNQFSDEVGEEDLPAVETVVANVDDPLNPTKLVDSADLAFAMTQDATVPIRVDFVTSHPDQPEWFFISASAHPDVEVNVNYILAYRRDLDEVAVLQNLGQHSLNTPLQIYSNGRVLSFGTFGPTNSSSDINQFVRLIPLQPDEMEVGNSFEAYNLNAGFVFDWSLDGRWLLIAEQSRLRLIVPGTDYDETILHGFDNCYQAAWVNGSNSTESSP